jgi:transposase
MSNIHVIPFFQFCRVEVMEQTVELEKNSVHVKLRPDTRYRPLCSKCKKRVKNIHSYNHRIVRDLNLIDARSYLSVVYRTVCCRQCGPVVEELPLMAPYKRVTRRLASYILELCRYMTIKEVAEHLVLDWKTVKAIHKRHLQEKFSAKPIGNPKILLVDEIAMRKGHTYLTLIADWDEGRILWVGEGRKYETVKEFFDSLSEEQKGSLWAIAMDMWDPYIKAVKECCPHVKIVFDQFHAVAAFNRVIDKVKNSEYRKATQAGKQVFKGSKYLLLKHKQHLNGEEWPRLKALLELNETLSIVYILKDSLKKLWHYKYPQWAIKALSQWYSIAYESGIKPVIAFARTLLRYAYGIINHCVFPIHTSRLEGINNKVEVIKRKAYGFYDIEYFSLVIKDAFSKSN